MSKSDFLTVLAKIGTEPLAIFGYVVFVAACTYWKMGQIRAKTFIDALNKIPPEHRTEFCRNCGYVYKDLESLSPQQRYRLTVAKYLIVFIIGLVLTFLAFGLASYSQLKSMAAQRGNTERSLQYGILSGDLSHSQLEPNQPSKTTQGRSRTSQERSASKSEIKDELRPISQFHLDSSTNRIWIVPLTSGYTNGEYSKLTNFNGAPKIEFGDSVQWFITKYRLASPSDPRDWYLDGPWYLYLPDAFEKGQVFWTNSLSIVPAHGVLLRGTAHWANGTNTAAVSFTPSPPVRQIDSLAELRMDEVHLVNSIPFSSEDVHPMRPILNISRPYPLIEAVTALQSEE